MKWSLLCVFIFLITSLHSVQTLHFEEDGRNWIYAGRANTGEITFIPEGDTAQDWKEIFVLHHVAQSKIPLDVYYQNFIYALNAKSSGLYNSKIIESEDNSILFEWWMDSDIPNAQHGWVKVFYTEDGIGFMRYTTKNLRFIEKIKPIWENILSTYEIELFPEHIDIAINWEGDPKKWTRDEMPGIETYRLSDKSEDELVTIETLETTPNSLRDYYENETAGANVNARILSDTGTRILYEWSYQQGSKTVHVWTFISKENRKAAVVVRHISRLEKNSEEREKVWERILKDVKVDVKYNFKPIKKEAVLDESTSKSKE